MPTVRPPVSEFEIGSRGWQVLHEDARRRGRRPNRQLLAWVQYVVKRRLDGEEVELSDADLDQLLQSAAA